MSIDDDLFEDNEVTSTYDYDNDTDGIDDLRSLSPEYQNLVKFLKEQFDNVNSFSFAIYPETYLLILEQIQHIHRNLSEVETANIIAPEYFLNDTGRNTYRQWLSLLELERAIMAAGYFNEIIFYCVDKLRDNPSLEDPDGYVTYVYNSFVKELAFSTIYASDLINSYETFCEQNGFETDSNLITHQIKSFLTVTDRQVYGNNLHSFELEMIGEIPKANEQRDESNSAHAGRICEFIFVIERVVNAIKSGDYNSVDFDL